MTNLVGVELRVGRQAKLQKDLEEDPRDTHESVYLPHPRPQ